MMTDKKYNGWNTFETWLVSLWLDNEEPSYRYWREQTAYHHRAAPACKQVKEGIWNTEQAARINLANQLKAEIIDESPVSGASLYCDLLNAAFSEVDWYEIAENLLMDIPDEDNEEEINQETHVQTEFEANAQGPSIDDGGPDLTIMRPEENFIHKDEDKKCS
jgi:hypothetical protein